MGLFAKVTMLLILTINSAMAEASNPQSISTYNVTYNLTIKLPYSNLSPATPKLVSNLYSILEHFFIERCLVVINNFEGIDLPKSDFPVILRRFTLAELGVKFKFSWEDTTDYNSQSIWIPPEQVSKLSGSFTKQSTIKTKEYYDFYEPQNSFGLPCSISKYFYSVFPADENSGHCVGLNKTKFASASKAWQGEVQVDLYMPDAIFSREKHTQIFRLNSPVTFFPSLRPPIHILVDGKLNVEEYNKLATWITRISFWHRTDNSLYGAVNDFQFTAHVQCDSKSHKISHLVCNIKSVNVIYLCPFCKNYILSRALDSKYLSHNYVTQTTEHFHLLKYQYDVW